MEQIGILTSDGLHLAATRFAPAGKPGATIVIPGAMGVTQDYYEPFARFLAEQGLAAITFDYRGMGRSIPESHRRSLRGFQADLFDWAERDYNAVLRYAKQWQPDVPLFVVGHSLGGQLPGLLPDNHLIDGIVTVGAGNGYWRWNAPQLKRVIWFLWYFAVPVYTRIWGYFPGRKMRKVGNLPKGVIYQWSQWCRNPHYVVDGKGRPMRSGFDRLRIPVLGLSFTDDEMLSKRSIDNLHGFYRNAAVERRHISPQEAGAKRVGHMGFFRPQFRETLWQHALQWLQQRVAHEQQARTA
jgi:predicted alpha/beta hydrolase